MWACPAAICTVLGAPTQQTRLLDRVQIDGLGVDTITLSGHGLRSNALRLLGSGFVGGPRLRSTVRGGRSARREAPAPARSATTTPTDVRVGSEVADDEVGPDGGARVGEAVMPVVAALDGRGQGKSVFWRAAKSVRWPARRTSHPVELGYHSCGYVEGQRRGSISTGTTLVTPSQLVARC